MVADKELVGRIMCLILSWWPGLLFLSFVFFFCVFCRFCVWHCAVNNSGMEESEVVFGAFLLFVQELVATNCKGSKSLYTHWILFYCYGGSKGV